MTFRKIQESETPIVSELFLNTFLQFNAATCDTEEGVEAFKTLVSVKQLTERLRAGSILIVGILDETIIAATEMLTKGHILLVYVGANVQGKGIGRLLLEQIVQYARKHLPHLEMLTLNSAVTAVDFYLKFGFEIAGDTFERNGIRATPMRILL